ncbi:cell division protein ZapE [Kineobactrum sediminis]|uniref:Cell division protein ZapE n=1 Tax=Kineobactrum sediminis TaxID=1905677 RepID=A0A2N5Y3E9_9GAMM|nr:cell division protein ZapE [Kineobactrum sediminis]PLW82921.1 cell division protein ZapE [Kineobactrum sediminis]
MTPWQRYQADLEQPDFVHDQAQEEAVRLLQELYDRLLARHRQSLRWWQRLRRSTPEPEIGLYLWGGVGRGKTYLVDTFYECLPLPNKTRVHFHRFMQRVHVQLREFAGEKNPLELVADQLASEAGVICFDEFFVTDIADAMILGGLMEALFERGVTLVATSNIEPHRLYENGLQRQRFLPAIALIERYTKVVNVDAGVDYRLRTLEQAELYHCPLDEAADLSLRQSFERLAPHPGHAGASLSVNGRELRTRSLADDVVWFDFAELCEGPRSQNDYIELARIFHAVVLSAVPAMGSANDDAARRFINLVDEFYDRNVKLVMAADRPLLELYDGRRLRFEFQRTVSRLQEMQSHEYLAREHRP